MTTYTSPSGKSTATNDCSGGHSIEVSHPSKPVDRNSELREVLEDCLVMKEHITELERERDGLYITFEREFKALSRMYVAIHNSVYSGEYYDKTPEGMIFDEISWVDNRWLDITDPLFTSYSQAVTKRDLEQHEENTVKFCAWLVDNGEPIPEESIIKYGCDYINQLRNSAKGDSDGN